MGRSGTRGTGREHFVEHRSARDCFEFKHSPGAVYYNFSLEGDMKIDISGGEIKIFDFDALEAYTIAGKMESEGISLYRSMRDNIDDPGVKEAIGFLISEEREHLVFFEKRVNELVRSGEKATDLADIADSKVMSELVGLSEPGDLLFSGSEALKLAVSIEKRAISFYSQMLENTSDAEGREALQQIIKEEESHRDKFKSML